MDYEQRSEETPTGPVRLLNAFAAGFLIVATLAAVYGWTVAVFSLAAP
jgi:hypothetical protein